MDTMITKINNITCLQETKWLKTKSREIEIQDIDYSSQEKKEKHRNEIGIVVDKKLEKSIVDIRVCDGIIRTKIVSGEILNIIIA